MPKSVQECRTSSISQKCRTCGCTDNDCRGCIERTGHPYYWAEQYLCSACAPIADKKQHFAVHVEAMRFKIGLTNEECLSLAALDGNGHSQDYVVSHWHRLRRRFGHSVPTSPDGRYVIGSGTKFTYQDELVLGVIEELRAEAAVKGQPA